MFKKLQKSSQREPSSSNNQGNSSRRGLDMDEEHRYSDSDSDKSCQNTQIKRGGLRKSIKEKLGFSKKTDNKSSKEENFERGGFRRSMVEKFSFKKKNRSESPESPDGETIKRGGFRRSIKEKFTFKKRSELESPKNEPIKRGGGWRKSIKEKFSSKRNNDVEGSPEKTFFERTGWRKSLKQKFISKKVQEKSDSKSQENSPIKRDDNWRRSNRNRNSLKRKASNASVFSWKNPNNTPIEAWAKEKYRKTPISGEDQPCCSTARQESPDNELKQFQIQTRLNLSVTEFEKDPLDSSTPVHQNTPKAANVFEYDNEGFYTGQELSDSITPTHDSPIDSDRSSRVVVSKTSNICDIVSNMSSTINSEMDRAFRMEDDTAEVPTAKEQEEWSTNMRFLPSSPTEFQKLNFCICVPGNKKNCNCALVKMVHLRFLKKQKEYTIQGCTEADFKKLKSDRNNSLHTLMTDSYIIRAAKLIEAERRTTMPRMPLDKKKLEKDLNRVITILDNMIFFEEPNQLNNTDKLTEELAAATRDSCRLSTPTSNDEQASTTEQTPEEDDVDIVVNFSSPIYFAPFYPGDNEYALEVEVETTEPLVTRSRERRLTTVVETNEQMSSPRSGHEACSQNHSVNTDSALSTVAETEDMENVKITDSRFPPISSVDQINTPLCRMRRDRRSRRQTTFIMDESGDQVEESEEI